jgi:hypothetical protein
MSRFTFFIKVIKSRRKRWAGDTSEMLRVRNIDRNVARKTAAKILLGRLRVSYRRILLKWT